MLIFTWRKIALSQFRWEKLTYLVGSRLGMMKIGMCHKNMIHVGEVKNKKQSESNVLFSIVRELVHVGEVCEKSIRLDPT